MTFPLTTRWCYDYQNKSPYGCVQGKTLMKPVKFGEDQTMYSEVTAVFVLFPVFWQNIEIRCPTTTTSFYKNSRFIQL